MFGINLGREHYIDDENLNLTIKVENGGGEGGNLNIERHSPKSLYF